MKLTYAYPRKCPTTLLRFVLGTLLMKLAPGYLNLMAAYGYGSLTLAWQAWDMETFLYHAPIG